MKAQAVRLIDVFLLGPAMMALAFKPRMTESERFWLAVAGAATIIYNGANFLQQAREEIEQ